MVDWDNGSRTERIDVIDWGTGAVLDSRTIGHTDANSSFVNGEYLTWNLSGHVRLAFNNVMGDGEMTGANAVLSGLFFGGAL